MTSRTWDRGKALATASVRGVRVHASGTRVERVVGMDEVVAEVADSDNEGVPEQPS